jgi:ATP-dependent Zn protease
MPMTNESMYRVLSAYHEAGHAVVGHLIGRYIQEISIVSGKGQSRGYSGYCRFNAFVEDMHLHPEWHESKKNPEMITIYYAGMIAMAYFCAANEGTYEYLEGSEQSDLEKVDQLLLQIGSNEEERSHLKDTCWEHVQKLLSNNWHAVDEVATQLLE